MGACPSLLGDLSRTLGEVMKQLVENMHCRQADVVVDLRRKWAGAAQLDKEVRAGKGLALAVGKIAVGCKVLVVGPDYDQSSVVEAL